MTRELNFGSMSLGTIHRRLNECNMICGHHYYYSTNILVSLVEIMLSLHTIVVQTTMQTIRLFQNKPLYISRNHCKPCKPLYFAETMKPCKPLYFSRNHCTFHILFEFPYYQIIYFIPYGPSYALMKCNIII